MNASTTNTTSATREPENDTLVESLMTLGTTWARYGLRIGSAALRANSHTVETYGKALGEALEHTAKALNSIADNLGSKPATAEGDAATATKVEPVDPTPTA